jgi:CheY-like chemotaxis protein
VTDPTMLPPSGWEVDIARPSAARIYDYFLGGYHNFESDRRVGRAAIDIFPDLPLILQANRAFLRRSVRFLVEQGIDQFIDVGAGIPTSGPTHEVARAVNPEARVLYVDNDPVAVTQARALLEGDARSAVIQADGRRPREILEHAETRALLDLTRPVAVLLLAFLHFVPDQAEAEDLVRVLREAVPSGSYFALTHATNEGASREAMERMSLLYAQTNSPYRARGREEIEPFFAGLTPVEPGLVYMTAWRPESEDDLFVTAPERCSGYAGVAFKG